MSKLSFTANGKKLQRAFDLICKVPGSTGSLIPITIDAGMEGVTLTRRTPSAWVKVDVEEAIVDDDGSISIFPEQALKSISNVLSEEIEVSHDGAVTEISGDGSVKIKAFANGETDVKAPTADFTPMNLSCGELLDAMKAVAPVCKNQHRDNLNGMMFGSLFPGFNIMGADGRSLHRVSITGKGLFPSLLLPNPTVGFVIAALSGFKEKQKASLKMAAKLIGLDIPGISMRLATSETSPMAFSADVQKKLYQPSTPDGELKANSKKLYDTVIRSNAMADPATGRICLQREEEELVFKVESTSTDASYRIQCSGKGITEPIYVNGGILLEAIRVFHSIEGDITLRHIEDHKCVRIEEGNKTTIVYLQNPA